MKMKNNRLSQKQIYSFIATIFFIMVLFSILSIINLQHNLKINHKAQQELDIAQKLIEAQNDLIAYQTNEAEAFIMTHDISHLMNFASRDGHIQTIRTSIEHLKATQDAQNERKYWHIVEENTTLLFYTQLRAIKLTAESLGFTTDQLPDLVTHYQLNWPEQRLSPQAQQEKAQALLFSSNYHDEQTIITHNIQRFKTAILSRLNQQTQTAIDNTNSAIRIEYLTQVLLLVIFILILGFFFKYVVHPIQHYTQALERQNWTEATPPLIPQGFAELYTFAENFNHLYDQMIRVTNIRTDLLSETSHELRTPLNAISGYSHLLRKTNLSPAQLKYATIIEQSSDHLVKVINNILDFKKIEAQGLVLKPFNFSLQALFHEVISLHQASAVAKNITLDLQLEQLSIDQVYADRERLSQVLINLINNAIKFTDHGFITLRVEEEFLTKLPTQNIFLKIQVIDTGMGIKKVDLDRIFKRYEQIEDLPFPTSTGTGLGLSISQKIIKKMGGQLSVKSRESQGTTFTITIKLKQYSRQSTLAITQNSPTSGLSEYQILLVDDNALNLQMTSELLQQYGAHITTASTGQEALKQLQLQKFDLIFLDLRLPDLSGIEVVKEIRSGKGCNATSKVIALTADAEINRLKLALAAGMDDYLTKPIDFGKLETLIFEIDKQPNKNIDYNSYRSNFFTAYLPQIQNLSNLNPTERQHLLHDIKGLSGNLKLEGLYQETLSVATLENLNWISSYQERFETIAKKHLNSNHNTNHKSRGKPLNSELIAHLKTLIQTANPMAFELITGYDISPSLYSALESYDFSKALILLEKERPSDVSDIIS